MVSRIIAFIFFTNYFIGFLAVALSLETIFQLNLPANSFLYYTLLFSSTVFYYTFAYSVPVNQRITTNPRTEWYRQHASFICKSQIIFLSVFVAIGLWFLIHYFNAILDFPFSYWLLICSVPLAALLYYGLLPKSFLNLRRTGWLKAFVIGFVWAGCVSLFPIMMLKLEKDISLFQPTIVLWFFVKNWFFCTVNAIMFDIKDYEDDANIELKTFVVRFGLRNTIFFILIPLLAIGLLAFLVFTGYRGFGTLRILINLAPFICLILIAFALQKPRKILYYLVVIDGLLLVKAMCGIIGSFI